jgi:hypothetical protein
MSTLSGLNKWVGRQMRGHDDGDLAQYENRVHEARLDERRRVARELHDRLGEVLTVGLRQLDLDEILGPEIPEGQSAIARQVLVEAMRRLRLVTSGLRPGRHDAGGLRRGQLGRAGRPARHPAVHRAPGLGGGPGGDRPGRPQARPAEGEAGAGVVSGAGPGVLPVRE